MAGDMLLGIDLGAGSLKATLITVCGRTVASASAPVKTSSPHPGWSEQDPAEWWLALCIAVRRALEDARGAGNRIAAVSLSAGAHTQVLEDENGAVIRPAIMWNDQRAQAETRELQAEADELILQLGGNRANPTWTLPQMLWLRRNEPDAFKRIRRLYLAKDWLRSRLTGTWETDPIDAVGALMSDPRGRAWSPDLCAMIGFPMAALPPIVATSDTVGTVTADAAQATGLALGTPVICGTSDTAAETYCAGMTESGIGVFKLATAATVAALSPAPKPGMSVINYPHVMPDSFYTIVGTNSCASAHRWLRDTFFMRSGDDGGAVFSAMDESVATTATGAEGLFFHPYLNGERSPYWDPKLRADFVGIGFNHGAGHFVRALYEGIGYSLRDCLESLRGAGIEISSWRAVGGGTRSRIWVQIVADILGMEVELPENGDASYGAALIAGIGAGVFRDAADAARCIRTKERFVPDAGRSALYGKGFGIYRDIQSALAPINHAILAMGDTGLQRAEPVGPR